jgi:hypothetical protein
MILHSRTCEKLVRLDIFSLAVGSDVDDFVAFPALTLILGSVHLDFSTSSYDVFYRGCRCSLESGYGFFTRKNGSVAKPACTSTFFATNENR